MYNLDGDIKLSEHFHISEFVCTDPKDLPGKVFLEMELVEKLERFRSLLKMPLVVTSGYRTAKWNRIVGGSPASRHLLGQAADIRMDGHYDKDRITVFAVNAGFKGIGLYDGFIHLDIRRELFNKGGRSFDLWDLKKK